MFNPPIAEGDGVSTGGIFGDTDNSLFSTPQRTAGVGNAVGGTLFPGQANMTGVGFVERGSSSGAFETPLIPTSQPTDNELNDWFFKIETTPQIQRRSAFPGTLRMGRATGARLLKPRIETLFQQWQDVVEMYDLYNLIFVPFTGVDNNKRCVTFGAGLLFYETIEVYTWLLRAFLEAHNKQPSLVLTDQDPTMRQVVAAVLDRSLHRLCMWHIMKKLPSKITGEVAHNSEFRAAIHKLVWNIYIKPETFERRWGKLLEKYGLEEHEWLRDMYNIKEMWVPAQRVGDFKADDHAHEFKTSLAIEKHCTSLYSLTIYVEVRKEILKGLLHCYTTGVEEVDGKKIYTVTHLDKNSDVVNDFTVKVDPEEDTTTCSCNLWCRIGYLCRHIFCVFRQTKVDEIPLKYVVSHWGRHVLPKSVFRVEFRYGVDLSPAALTRNNLEDCFSEALQAMVGDRATMEDLVVKIKGWTKEITDARRGKSHADAPETQVMADLLGVVVEGESSTPVSCSNPQGIRNNGCGTNKCKIGPGERAVQIQQKPQRLCRTWNRFVTGHDSRNCPEKRKNAEP
ncbi:uncharacterized protein LOC110892265 [Helianthus annuus]|uniref:uncharacterized protein LOC110892265 n=1 Tax=Helianthus annuus TaxID=4232 RepID=UPI001652C279|nr:uncharacterized protein LOC110892265 [Helianthus annuus]